MFDRLFFTVTFCPYDCCALFYFLFFLQQRFYKILTQYSHKSEHLVRLKYIQAVLPEKEKEKENTHTQKGEASVLQLHKTKKEKKSGGKHPQFVIYSNSRHEG